MSNQDVLHLPLAPYVPRSVVARLAPSVLGTVDVDELDTVLPWPLRPNYRSLGDCSVFLLDLSGYTQFASTRGAEEVATVVNGLFTKMIDVVHSFKHCEVVKFCGDALLCLCCWPSENDTNNLALALETAIACSLAVQTEVFPDTENEEAKLSLHVGIAAGSIVELFVGGGVSERFEHLIAGAPLEVLGGAVDAAKAGQVIVHASSTRTSAVLEQLQKSDRIQGVLQSDGFLALAGALMAGEDELRTNDHNKSPIEDLHIVDDSALERLNQALMSFTPLDFLPQGAEFRQCSILFAALPDFSFEDNGLCDTAFQETQHIVEELQKALQEYGGNMRQLLQDDKGTVAIAVFGLPTRSQEDDAARAVKTAMAITSRTPCTAVGVATGDVLVGLTGSSQRCEYSVLGDSANMAARLMGACSKLDQPVLVCSSTQEAALRTCTGSLAFPEKHTIELKGKGEKDVYVPAVAGLEKVDGHSRASIFLFQSALPRTETSDSEISDVNNEDTSINNEDAKESDEPELNDFVRGRELLELPRTLSHESETSDGNNEDTKKSDVNNEDAKESDEPELNDFVRGRELLEIRKAMPGGAVCLIGEAGQGKTTLAASFAEHAVDSNIVASVVYAAADSTETETPFFAFKYVVGEFCRQEGGLEAAFRTCGLDPLMAPLINPLLEEHLPTNAECACLCKESHRQQAVAIVAKFVTHLTQTDESWERTGKLLVIDDVHWIDELSALVVKRLAQTDCSLLWTARYLPKNLEGTALEVNLQPLSYEEARVLAGPFHGKVSDEEVRALFERSEGNALFFKEMLRYSAAGRSDGNANLPSTVRGVLVSRIDALSPQGIEFLKAASVLGRTFAPENVAKLMGKCDAAVESLCLESELIERINLGNLQDDKKTMWFSHALARDAAYSLIPKVALAALHDEAALLVQSIEAIVYHRVAAAEASPTCLRLKLAVQSLSECIRDQTDMAAMTLDKARELWHKVRALLETMEDRSEQRQLELQFTLHQRRVVAAWLGFGAAEAEELFTKALSLTERGAGTEEEIMCLSGLWMNAMSNLSSKEIAQKALGYAEELRDLAIDPSSIARPGEMDWTVKEIYHVIWTEYGRRGRLRDMKRFLDPLLEAPTPHGGNSVLGHNAETCATVFGAKVAWLMGQFDEALPIASSGIGLTNETFSVSQSRVWGVAQILAWNGQLDACDATLEDKALDNMPPVHVAVREVLAIYKGILKAEIPLVSVHQRLMKTPELIPFGEFPFTLCYALIQRGYELKLDVPRSARVPELEMALSLVLAYWNELRDRSDGWGPGLFHWASGVLQLFENPSCAAANNMAVTLFGTGSFLAQEEGALGVQLLIETSRVKMMLQRTSRFPQSLQDAANELQRIRHLCTGDPAIVRALAFADDVLGQVAKRRRPGKMFVGALSVSAAAAGAFLFQRRGNRR